MAFFSETVAAVLRGATIRRARLVEMDFASGIKRLFEGAGIVRTADGNLWYGAGMLGQIGDIDNGVGGSIEPVTFTLSGVDPTLLAPTLAASDNVKDRDITVYAQYFDENWQPLDAPYAMFLGYMDKVTVDNTASSCVITLTAESILARGSYPPLGWQSDRDQKRLHPGDRGVEQTPSMASKSFIWPT